MDIFSIVIQTVILLLSVAGAVWQLYRVLSSEIKDTRDGIHERLSRMEANFDTRTSRVEERVQDHGERLAVLADRVER